MSIPDATRRLQRDGINRESILEHFLPISKQKPSACRYRVLGCSVILENQNLVTYKMG